MINKFVRILSIIFIPYFLYSRSFTQAHSSSNPSGSLSDTPTFVTDKNVPNHDNQKPHSYEILNSEVVYSRWRSIINRKVRMPNGHIVDYDIVDQRGAGAVIIFAWNSKNKTATIVREYNPGCNKILSGLAAGIIETNAEKHNSDPFLAAQHELEEECHLAGGTWHRLVDENVQIPMDKYAKTAVVPYLVIDPHEVTNPRPLDAEEEIEIVSGVTIDKLMEIIRQGDMNLVGAWATLLAIEKLRQLNEI